MNEEAPERERVVNRERVIEDAIMRSPDELGYPGARSIRNWRVALTCGRLDVGLLPIKGPKKLVLVEAKCVKAPDAASKVVGRISFCEQCCARCNATTVCPLA